MHETDFWYSIGSTSTYLTLSRLPKMSEDIAVNIIWRPFNVRDINFDQKNIPFSNNPVKSAYIGRDIES